MRNRPELPGPGNRDMAGTGREARYTNLPPGKYHFVFQAANRGIWLNEESSTWFIIRPFFWKTWWFITLVLTAEGFILFRTECQAGYD
jgi:hypothetical protein